MIQPLNPQFQGRPTFAAKYCMITFCLTFIHTHNMYLSTCFTVLFCYAQTSGNFLRHTYMKYSINSGRLSLTSHTTRSTATTWTCTHTCFLYVILCISSFFITLHFTLFLLFTLPLVPLLVNTRFRFIHMATTRLPSTNLCLTVSLQSNHQYNASSHGSFQGWQLSNHHDNINNPSVLPYPYQYI